MLEFRIFLLKNGFASQRQFAFQAGISPQFLNDILMGRRKASKTRRRLTVEFGVPARLIAYKKAA